MTPRALNHNGLPPSGVTQRCMTPMKVLLAAALTLAVLAAGCASRDNNEATDGQNASDENSSLYSGDEAPGLEENAPGDSGNQTSNETTNSTSSGG